MGWFNKIFKGSNQRLRVGNNKHHHNVYYDNYPTASHDDEPSADTDADNDEPHTQEPSTSEVSMIQMLTVYLNCFKFSEFGDHEVVKNNTYIELHSSVMYCYFKFCAYSLLG